MRGKTSVRILASGRLWFLPKPIRKECEVHGSHCTYCDITIAMPKWLAGSVVLTRDGGLPPDVGDVRLLKQSNFPSSRLILICMTKT